MPSNGDGGFSSARLVVIVAVTAVATVQFASRAEVAGVGDGKLVGGLADDVEDALSDDGRYLLRWWDPAGLGGPGFGLQVELERRGKSIGVDEQFAAASLPHRVLAEADATAVLYLVVGPKADEVRGTPGVQEITSFDPRTPEEQARSAELRAALEARLVEVGRAELVEALDAQYGQARLIFADPPLPPDVAAMAGEFVDLRQPGAVFLAPPGHRSRRWASASDRSDQAHTAGEVALPHAVGVHSATDRLPFVQPRIPLTDDLGRRVGVLGEIVPAARVENDAVQASTQIDRPPAPAGMSTARVHPGCGKLSGAGLPSPNRLRTTSGLAAPLRTMSSTIARTTSSRPNGTTNWYCTKPRRP